MAIRKAAKLEDAKIPTEPAPPPEPTATDEQRAQPDNPARRYPRGVQVLSSKINFRGPLFNVQTDQVREPGGKESRRDVVRHGGSIVILAVDETKSRRDPLIIIERQYRHAAGQYLFELPAGKLDPNEDPLKGAKRELLEETGYRARRWTKLVRFFASPGFLGEWMQVYVAEELTAGEAQPEEDEMIKLSEMPLSELLRQIEGGKILDGKTIASVLLYDRIRKQRATRK
ncbi:MAG: NUDIX hydrolase [Acidobacteriaceae bacterium]